MRAIKEEGFEEPSEIQEKAIPLVLEGKDVIAGSATGSGKTLVFGAGIIRDVEKGKGIQALVLTPTRELAEQVAVALRRFSKHKPLNITMVYGGVSINPQIDALRAADVVVGTPGRILDHMERRTINFNHVKILVLDEADRMFDMGFRDDVERIIRVCPKPRQTLLFSATLSEEGSRLADKHMKNPVEVAAETYVDPSKLRQVYYDVPNNMKFSLLVHLLRNEHAGLVMIFCNTRQTTDFVAKNLKHNEVPAQAIHGGFSQGKRSRTMEQFHSKDVYVLVCTDVAARGLDIKGVSHVYNYDTPKDSKQYIHRIGRTARAGKEGIAVTLLSDRDYENFDRVLRDNAVEIAREEVPQIERVRMDIGDRGRGNFRGGRDRDFRPGQGHGGHGGRQRNYPRQERNEHGNRGPRNSGRARYNV
ncbi:ATP-dependent RNA helicase [Candidatus Woesearchaeota archaeon CG10_big_fil_rev_8_21_14_0_10_44_13]|nr:MAG: ATP-dependent RNA helicase [Candidatus Woesearchaeota archaeon CG10_big_fil_rev_8_21_14_0_10_44_13]